jgi:hypothetical protein
MTKIARNHIARHRATKAQPPEVTRLNTQGDSLEIVEHRHITGRREIVEALQSNHITAEQRRDYNIRLQVLDGIIKLASELSADRSVQPCYEDICTLITELV